MPTDRQHELSGSAAYYFARFKSRIGPNRLQEIRKTGAATSKPSHQARNGDGQTNGAVQGHLSGISQWRPAGDPN